MSKKRNFVLGALAGLGLGVLFAPKKGSETREDIKEKLKNLKKQIEDVDKEELKEDLMVRFETIKQEISNLDRETVLEKAKVTGNEIKKETEKLVELAKVKGTPLVRKAADELRLKAIDVTKEVTKRLENAEIK